MTGLQPSLKKWEGGSNHFAMRLSLLATTVLYFLKAAPQQKSSPRNLDRKSTRLNSSYGYISYAVFCLKKKKGKLADAKSILAVLALGATGGKSLRITAVDE